MVKNLPAKQETRVQSLDQEDPLEKGMATHSSILAWEIPRTEEPGGLQSTGSQRVRHDWVANTLSVLRRARAKGELLAVVWGSRQAQLSPNWRMSYLIKKEDLIDFLGVRTSQISHSIGTLLKPQLLLLFNRLKTGWNIFLVLNNLGKVS